MEKTALCNARKLQPMKENAEIQTKKHRKPHENEGLQTTLQESPFAWADVVFKGMEAKK